MVDDKKSWKMEYVITPTTGLIEYYVCPECGHFGGTNPDILKDHCPHCHTALKIKEKEGACSEEK